MYIPHNFKPRTYRYVSIDFYYLNLWVSELTILYNACLCLLTYVLVDNVIPNI